MRLYSSHPHIIYMLTMLICVQVRHGDTHNLIPLPSPGSKEQQISVTFTIQPRPRQWDTAGDISW